LYEKEKKKKKISKECGFELFLVVSCLGRKINGEKDEKLVLG